MGLFSFFARNGHVNGASIHNRSTAAPTPNIPEEVFIAKESPLPPKPESTGSEKAESGISVLFAFLERNHEAKGYDDALVNPDNRHLEHHLEALQNELERTIRKVK